MGLPVSTLAEFGTGQLFWSMIWFTLFFIWVWILFTCFADIFRDDSLGGWGKAAWCLFIIVLPYLGVFVYVIARGSSMQKRQMDAAVANAQAQRAYIQTVAGTGSASSGVADEIGRLADLRDKGVLSDDEFNALKAKALA